MCVLTAACHTGPGFGPEPALGQRGETWKEKKENICSDYSDVTELRGRSLSATWIGNALWKKHFVSPDSHSYRVLVYLEPCDMLQMMFLAHSEMKLTVAWMLTKLGARGQQSDRMCSQHSCNKRDCLSGCRDRLRWGPLDQAEHLDRLV